MSGSTAPSNWCSWDKQRERLSSLVLAGHKQFLQLGFKSLSFPFSIWSRTVNNLNNPNIWASESALWLQLLAASKAKFLSEWQMVGAQCSSSSLRTHTHTHLRGWATSACVVLSAHGGQIGRVFNLLEKSMASSEGWNREPGGPQVKASKTPGSLFRNQRWKRTDRTSSDWNVGFSEWPHKASALTSVIGVSWSSVFTCMLFTQEVTPLPCL